MTSYGIPQSEKGAANGVCDLGPDGFVPASRIADSSGLVSAIQAAINALPSTDTDVIERSSLVSTVPSRRGLSSLTLTASERLGVLATCISAGTFTKIRFGIGTTFTAVTDLRAGVYDLAAVKLGETANLIGLGGITTPAAGADMDNVPLLSGVTLATGQEVYLDLGFIGTACSAYGASMGTGAISAKGLHKRTRRVAWAGGTLPTNHGTSLSPNLPWVELIP